MTAEYSAHHLQVLEGLEAVRKRPGMYIGSTGPEGLHHLVYEIVDNSFDESLAGYCDDITVTLLDDGGVRVVDNGRGIPVSTHPVEGISTLEVVLTKLHAGGKFDAANYGAAGGLHGVGASVVNALSSRLDVEVDRGGRTWAMSFRRGVPGVFADGRDGPSPDSPFTEAAGAAELRDAGRAPKGATGTRIRYWADPQVFIRDAEFSLDKLTERAR